VGLATTLGYRTKGNLYEKMKTPLAGFIKGRKRDFEGTASQYLQRQGVNRRYAVLKRVADCETGQCFV
jgi:hypothetical protein